MVSKDVFSSESRICKYHLFLIRFGRINEFLVSLLFIISTIYRYLIVVRALQLTYRMEPAGSQGVWSLDDYQFISFIWGSAQFIGQMRGYYDLNINYMHVGK